MTKNLDNKGLKSIVENYDLFFIDLWGVVHNGIRLHKNAIKTLIDKKEKFMGHIFSGKYLDCGTLKGYINSSIEISKL